jgi:hypothetical protein
VWHGRSRDLQGGKSYEKISFVRMSGWLERQRGWRLFFIVWGFQLLFYAAVILGVSIGFAAYHPRQPFPAPPLWVFPLWALITAGFTPMRIRAMRRRKRIREAKASAKHAGL